MSINKRRGKEQIAIASLRKDRGGEDVDEGSSRPNRQVLLCARHIAPEHTLGVSTHVGESLFGGFSRDRSMLDQWMDRKGLLD